MSWHARTAEESLAGSNRSVRMYLPKPACRLPATVFHPGTRDRDEKPAMAHPSEPALALGYLDRFGTVAGAELLYRGGQVVADRTGRTGAARRPGPRGPRGPARRTAPRSPARSAGSHPRRAPPRPR